MCGSTGEQNQLQQEQLDAYTQAQQMTQQEYQNQQELYAPMSAQFKSIFSMGPDQEGFSAPELENLNATAIEGTAENYKNASKAVEENMAAEGGGTNPLPSGAQDELRQEVATSSAQQESSEENQIEEADYAKGSSDWKDAASGLETIAAGENPLGYESAATASGSAAGTTADQIASQNNSWINAAIGAVGTAAGGWATGGFKTP